MVIGLQIPGSRNKFDGVLNTLLEIAKHEGFKGLYRLEMSHLLYFQFFDQVICVDFHYYYFLSGFW